MFRRFAWFIYKKQTFKKKTDMEKYLSKSVDFVNPPSLVEPTFFSHSVKITAGTSLLFIGGQNGVDENGGMAGAGDVKKQGEQIIKNLRAILGASGIGFGEIIKWNVYIKDGYDPTGVYELFAKELANREAQPLITMIYVPRLALPDALMEVEAVAYLPEEK